MADTTEDTTPVLRLVEITLANYRGVMALETTPEQVCFVADNAEALADCIYVEGFTPRAAMLGDDVVGLVVWGPYYPDERYQEPPEPNVYQLDHVMLDINFQGQGLGCKLIDLAVKELSFIGDCNRIVLAVEPANARAIKVYRRAGFKECGRDHENHILMDREPILD
jgi:RimJ/RimL family protein N-acetyltransferase